MATVVKGDLYEQLDGKLWEIKRQIRQPGGYPHDPEALDKALQEIVEGKFLNIPSETLVKAANVFSISVNYSRSVKDLVRAGNYDWKDSDITDRHFPASRKDTDTVKVHLVHFNRLMSTEQVLIALDQQGFNPADLHTLLSLGEKYPDLQLKYPIVAPGSVWQDPSGYRFVPSLLGSGSGRSLGLVWLVSGWGGFYRFAAVRK